jgi:hypothetical protein
MSDGQPDWNVAVDDDGRQVVTHRHEIAEATAYLFSNPDHEWAECTMCGARQTLPAGSTTVPVVRQ